jgi:hypothetical protein
MLSNNIFIIFYHLEFSFISHSLFIFLKGYIITNMILLVTSSVP